jgi:pyridoxal biosynthesis lyase PdxS
MYTGMHSKQDELDWALDHVRVLENDIARVNDFSEKAIERFKKSLAETKELVKQIEKEITQS